MKTKQAFRASKQGGGYGFGTFQGVFTPSILTIIGVVMYLRFGWVLGNVGLGATLAIVTMGSAITFLTGLSISSLATNMRMKGGGAYFILSRSLGLEAGAALGMPLALSQAICVSFYVAGFAEALVNSQIPIFANLDTRIVGLVTLGILSLVSTLSADIALKSQYAIMAAIVLSLVSFFLGSAPAGLEPPAPADVPAPLGFWVVFAVFFPAVTGILSGLGMSGDLKNPGKSIPLGTLAAVLTGYAVYMAVPVALSHMVSDSAILRSDTMVLQRCARWQMPILLGVWAATLSSAVGSFLSAPRVMQALARDRLAPSFLARGFGKADDPRIAALVCFAIAAAGIWFGDINILAPVLTLFNLSTYGLLNLSAACEEAMSNPTWRPTFRVKSVFSFAGFAFCLTAMFMISPGWTFVALIFEALIFWIVKSRRMTAQWGDMRTGIYASLARFSLRKLPKERHLERNWRPNLLVFSRLPMQNMRIVELARDISSGRSFVTLASIIPEPFSTPEREAELRGSVLRTARKASLEAEVKILGAGDEWKGMSEMVRTYGFGPITPNTVMAGLPASGHASGLAQMVILAARLRKNVVLFGSGSNPAQGSGLESLPKDAPIDIWWRGGGRNGSLMLALAVLVSRSATGFGKSLRMNMIVNRRDLNEAKEELDAFLADVRVDAETRIVDSLGRSFTDVIKEMSSDASLTFIGLKPPQDGDDCESYGEYLSLLSGSLSGVNYPAFVLAAEDVDFKLIFS